MENNSELEKLEQFVDKLLGKYNELKKEYADLENNYWELQAECDTLNEELADLRTERTVVGERVAGLIGRIEQWESEQGKNVAESGEGENGADTPDEGGDNSHAHGGEERTDY